MSSAPQIYENRMKCLNDYLHFRCTTKHAVKIQERLFILSSKDRIKSKRQKEVFNPKILRYTLLEILSEQENTGKLTFFQVLNFLSINIELLFLQFFLQL